MPLDKEREALDASLTPFKHWDIIANLKWDLIWVFDRVAYQWWNPYENLYWDPYDEPFGNFIFAVFKKAIIKMGEYNTYWEDEEFKDWCSDVGVSIDRRKSDLSEGYRLAMKEEVELFNLLTSHK
jgi:hypothetical protein